MIIRKLAGRDIYPLYKIGLQWFRKEPWLTRRYLIETMNTPGYDYGAFDNNKLIGGIMVRKIDKPKLWIFFMAVDKNHQREGVGRALLDAVERKRPKGYTVMFVDTDDKYVAATKFYARCGFTRQAKIRDWFGINREGVIYSKRLR